MFRRMLDRGILTQKLFDELSARESRRKAAIDDYNSKAELIAIIEELK